MRHEFADYERTAIIPSLPNKPRSALRVNCRRLQRHLLGVAFEGAVARSAGVFRFLHDPATIASFADTELAYGARS